MRAVTTPSADCFWVSACLDWCGSRFKVSFSATIDSQAMYLRTASSRSCRRVLSTSHHHARVEIIGHVGAAARHGMDAREVARPAQVGTQALLELHHDLVLVADELLGPVLGELGDRGTGPEYQKRGPS